MDAGCVGGVKARSDDGAACGRPSRGGLAPRRWCQAGRAISWRRWLTSPAHRGDHGVTVKPSRRECRFESGEPVVTTLVCLLFICMRGCGCTWHPAFPAPSIYLGAREIPGKARAHGVARSRRRVGSSPLPPAREARGGEGSGVLERTHQEFDSRRYPRPRPLPASRKSASGEGRRKRFNIYFGYEDDWQICAWRAPSRWQFGNSNALRALTLLAGRWVAATEVRTPGNAAFPIFSRWSIDGFAAGAAWFGMAR